MPRSCPALFARLDGYEETPAPYDDDMARREVKSLEELVKRLENAPPPNPDDCTILLDGRRLDSREAVMSWIGEDALVRLEIGEPRVLDDGRVLDPPQAIEDWLAEEDAAFKAKFR